MIGKESGLVLKDKPSTGKDGGATWAYEVVGQTMVCPIIIEDLAPPGQMLIEVNWIFRSATYCLLPPCRILIPPLCPLKLQMLCEERGFFLEIADNIRGFGLTILKGLMELRDSKIWARFLVEVENETIFFSYRVSCFTSCFEVYDGDIIFRQAET